MTLTDNHVARIIELGKLYGASRLILFGSILETPETAGDIDLACDGVPGWKLYEMAARIEEELNIPLDIVPLTPATRFTRVVEKKGRVLI
jgi:predicted nucleotidyltransferase